MRLLFRKSIDNDFPGGIYLPAVGEIPVLDRIEPLAYDGPLLLPLRMGTAPAQKMVAEGQIVAAGAVLARDEQGYVLHAPRAGKIGTERLGYVDGRPGQPVLMLEPLPGGQPPLGSSVPRHPAAAAPGEIKAHLQNIDLAQIQEMAVEQIIARSGLLHPVTREPLAAYLAALKRQAPNIVVANAVPVEPSLNTPLAILGLYPEQVFAGLAILRKWLGAQRAILAYPHQFALDGRPAGQWEVRCVPVSEKYPQFRDASVLETLSRQGAIAAAGKHHRIPVFPIQLLRQLERLILGDEPPLHRVITVSGPGVERPGHWLVPMGLPLPVLLEKAGLKPAAGCVIEGGSMDGRALDPAQALISPVSESFMVLDALPRQTPGRCIRCGWCIEYCPARIDPARLYHLGEMGQFGPAARAGLSRCVECGICSYVCPSRLRIMEHLRMMKVAPCPKP